MTAVKITPFSPTLTDQVSKLIVDIQSNEFGVDISLSEQPDLSSIPNYYQNGTGNFWAAMVEDQVVGCVGLLDIGCRQGALRKMFVHRACRGDPFRVANRLLDTLQRWCRDRGISNVYLGTTSKFLAAHRFYEKHGFVLIDRDELPAAFPVMKVDTRFYTVKVAPASMA